MIPNVHFKRHAFCKYLFSSGSFVVFSRVRSMDITKSLWGPVTTAQSLKVNTGFLCECYLMLVYNTGIK